MEIEDIIVSKISGEELSAEDSARFDQWYSSGNGSREYYNSLLDVKSGLMRSAVPERVDIAEAWTGVKPSVKRSARSRVMKYAAILLLPLCAAASYLILTDRADKTVVEPGRPRAVLMLASGDQVELTDRHIALSGDGVGMVNDADSGLIYDQPATEDGPVIMHRIVVPRGGEYSLRLTDGTLVRLNSESTLKYPVTFAGQTREVILTGEGYFEVAPDIARPFIVKTMDYDIRVTGTEFNVQSYTAGKTVTTLIEGGVTIRMDEVTADLLPGEQAVIAGGDIVVGRVDTNRYTAWKNGDFSFTAMRLDDIMEQLMRWYDIEVDFVDIETRAFHFYAGFSRTSALHEILSVLEETNAVEFELKGNKLSIAKRRQ